MPAIRLIAIGMLALMLSGCGQLVSERLSVSNSASSPTCPITKKLVILPLADYSYFDDASLAMRRNVAIMENLTDQLVTRGYQLPVQEDLLKYLADNNIIRVNNRAAHSLDRELQGEWSAAMKAELAALIVEDQNKNSSGAQETSTAIDQKTLARIAADFNAGYIMRGRIVNFEFGEDNTWNPLKKGLLPVIIGGTNRAVLGVAKSETYDLLDQMVMGAALGGIAANNISTASSISSSSATLTGAGAGLLSSQSRGNEARVKLRLWVQSPETGAVVWTNMVEVKVKPQTVFADTSAASLFDIAINKAVSALVNDFDTNNIQ